MMRKTEETSGLSFVWLLLGLIDEGSVVLELVIEKPLFFFLYYTVTGFLPHNHEDFGSCLQEER